MVKTRTILLCIITLFAASLRAENLTELDVLSSEERQAYDANESFAKGLASFADLLSAEDVVSSQRLCELRQLSLS